MELQLVVSWCYGAALRGGANFIWAQRFVQHFVPETVARFVLSNGSVPLNRYGDCPAPKSFPMRASNSRRRVRQRNIHCSTSPEPYTTMA
jgi:hypothetical protein